MKKALLFLLSVVVTIFTYETRAQGTMWGVTQSGGTSGGGTLFKANFDGTNFQKVKDFTIDVPGHNPSGRLVAGPSPNLNGKLYGTTFHDGAYDAGIIFQYDPSNGGYTKIFDFTGLNGSNPVGTMVLYNNKFYGLTYSGGAFALGVMFSFDPATGSFTKEADFDPSTTGSQPTGYLTLFNNKIYGTTSAGGANNSGVLFEFDPTKAAGSNLVNKYNFDSNSSSPQGELVVAGSLLYGVTSSGGANNLGTIFEFDPAASLGSNYTKKVDFNAATGSAPTTGMTLVSSQLYGATSAGGANSAGTIFQYTPGTTSVTVKAEPTWPYAGISVTGTMLYTNGLLYGNNSYSMFSFDPNSLSYSELVRYDLTYGVTGVDVHSGYALGPDGNLYGIALYGGVAQGGTIIKYNPSVAPSSTNPIVTISFNTSSGTFQPSQLIYLNGKLYGHSYVGDENRGTIFEYTLSDGTFIDTGFDNFPQSSFPSDPILANGKLYGTIGQTVYEYDPVTHTITDKIVTDGGGVLGFTVANGLLYGISKYGGANATGYIVEYDPIGNTMTNKLDFETSYNGTAMSRFSQASNGLLYAVVQDGGSNGKGYIIEYTPGASTVSKKYEFNTGASYYNSWDLITSTANGKLYGIRTNGGENGTGSILEYTLPTPATPDGVLKEVYSFPLSGTGQPWGELVESGNGKLYGSTIQGGLNGEGTFFEYDPIQKSYVDKASFVPIDGYDQGGLLVIPDPQSITFNAPSPAPYGSVLKPATASSNLPIQYTSSNTNVAITQGDSIIVVGVGTTTITASQPGNGGYLAATPVQQTLTTIKADQTIAFLSLDNKKLKDPSFTLNATASSTLDVTYISSNPAVASISGNTVTILAHGSTDIQASQVGDDNYNAAAPVTKTLTIVNTTPTVANAIADQEALQLTPFTFTFASNVFADADGDVLTYSATKYDGGNLPAWLSFDATARTFSGTPGVNDTTATILLTANDGFSGTVNAAFKIRVKIITGIEPDANEVIKIYPNPVHHALTIESESGEILPVIIRSSLGEVIYQNEKGTQHEVNVSPWTAGLYIVEVRKANVVTQTKIIKY